MKKITDIELKQIKGFTTNTALVMADCDHKNSYYGVECTYIKNALDDETKQQIKIINTVLKDVIGGYSTFYNFKDINTIRFSLDYNYKTSNPQFIGVSYITFNELLQLNKTNLKMKKA